MDKYAVKMLIEMEAIKAEIEGMKVANSERDLPNNTAYNENKFYFKAEELRILASKHNEQL